MFNHNVFKSDLLPCQFVVYKSKKDFIIAEGSGMGFQGVQLWDCSLPMISNVAGPIWQRLSDMAMGKWENVLAKEFVQ